MLWSFLRRAVPRAVRTAQMLRMEEVDGDDVMGSDDVVGDNVVCGEWR